MNLYGISLGIFNITRAVLSVQEWNDPLFIQLMEAAVVVCVVMPQQKDFLISYVRTWNESSELLKTQINFVIGFIPSITERQVQSLVQEGEFNSHTSTLWNGP